MPIEVSCPACRRLFHAPDSAGGKTANCPNCGNPIQIPLAADDEILDAELVEAASPTSGEEFSVAPPPPLPDRDDRRPCPMCGEMILRDAVKCRFCGEIFDPILKAEADKLVASQGPDADLTTGEWVVAIICSTIGCIMGIIWMIQGKPKGKKMFLVSFGMQIFWGIVRAAIEVANQR